MKVLLSVLVGLLVGLILGGLLGLGAGLAWIEIFRPSSFEGYSAYVVGFVFIPLGAVAGALGLAVWLGRRASRARTARERR